MSYTRSRWTPEIAVALFDAATGQFAVPGQNGFSDPLWMATTKTLLRGSDLLIAPRITGPSAEGPVFSSALANRINPPAFSAPIRRMPQP